MFVVERKDFRPSGVFWGWLIVLAVLFNPGLALTMHMHLRPKKERDDDDVLRTFRTWKKKEPGPSERREPPPLRELRRGSDGASADGR
jgi:hypothetical protein